MRTALNLLPRSILPIAVASFLPLGCGGDAEPAPAPAGLEFTLGDASIRVPERMVAIDFARFDDAIATELERRIGGEQGRQLGKQVRAIATQGVLEFAAFDPSTPGDGFAENVNVIIVPLPAGADRASVLASNLAQFGQAGITVVGTDEFTVGDLVFDRFRTRMDAARTEGHAYVLVHGGKVHSITISAIPESADAFLAVGEGIVKDYRPR